MTTNKERATEIVRDCLAQAWNAGPIFDTRKLPDAAAQALADATPPILMPDLPRPTSDMLHAHWDVGTTIIHTGYGGTVIVEWQPGPDNAVAIFTPDQVKAILAAHLHRDRWREREERMEKELNDHHAEQESKK